MNRRHAKSVPVMGKYYNIESNRNEPVLLEKMNTSAIYKRHGDTGFVIVSANRSDLPAAENEANTKELLADIHRARFRYLPVYGGYRGTDGVEDDYEPSFLVFPYNTDGKPVDFAKLEAFAIAACGKYDQDSVFVMGPGKNPDHVDRNGNRVNTSSSRMLHVNDLAQQFFTSFKDNDAVDAEVSAKLKRDWKQHRAAHPGSSFDDYKRDHEGDVRSIGRRFTADIKYEWFVNPAPRTFNERMRRFMPGEILF